MPESEPERLGPWLVVLIGLLTVWEPLTLALVLASSLQRTFSVDLAGALVVLARGLAAGCGIAAGLALWGRRPHALGLTRLALLLGCAATLVGLFSSTPFSSFAPSERRVVAGLAVFYYAAWWTYLARSRRVRIVLAGNVEVINSLDHLRYNREGS